MKNFQQHFYLIVLFHLLFTGCGSYSSDEGKMDGSFHTVVSSISPSDEVSSVSTDTSILVTFSEEMSSSSVTTNTSDTTCSGTLQVSYDNFTTCIQLSSSPAVSNSNKTYSVTPSSSLSYGTNYKVSLTSEIDEASGSNKFNQYITPTGFTTEIFVASTSPADAGTLVSLLTTISVTFSETMDTSSVTTNTSGTTCSGTIQVSIDNFSTCVQMSSFPVASNSNKTYTLTPSSDLIHLSIYKIRVTTGVKDIYGNGISNNFETSNGFTTSGMFAAVISDDILTSPDGETWTLRSIGTSTYQSPSYNAITYGNGNFLAVGNTGAILTSTDGINWSSRFSGTSDSIAEVTSGNSIFVIVGGDIRTSSDGISWTLRDDPSAWLGDITYGNNTFVTVGDDGTILTSSDGITWTSRTSGTSNGLHAVSFGNDLFIAVGYPHTILRSSDNGTSWSTITTGSSTRHLNAVTFGNNMFITVGTDRAIFRSPDNGTSWNWRGNGWGGDFDLYGVTFGNNIFTYVASDSRSGYSSDNGASFSATFPPVSYGSRIVDVTSSE